MAYQIPQQLEYREKIMFGLDFKQLTYAGTFGFASVVCIKVIPNILGYIAATIPTVVGLGFMFLDFEKKIKDYINYRRNRVLDRAKAKKFMNIEKIKDHLVHSDAKVAVIKVQPINFSIKPIDLLEQKDILLKNYEKCIECDANIEKLAEFIEDIYYENYKTFFSVSRFKDVINSDLKPEKKSLYVNIHKHFEENLPIDNFEERAKEKLEEKFYEVYSMKTPDIRIDTICKLLTISIDSEDIKGQVNKRFELNKVYKILKGQIKVKKINPKKATEYLVVGLLGSRDKYKIEESKEFFKENTHKLEEAKKYIQSSGHKKKMFKELDFNDPIKVINYLKNVCSEGDNKKVEPLSDLVNAVDALYTKEQRYDELHYKTQSGTLEDLFDNKSTLCCAFYPDGVNAEASIDYLFDSDIALLQLSPICDGEYLDSKGVAITVFVENDEKQKGLLVDSVEGGNLPKNWKEDFYSVIQEFAEDNDCKYVMFNKNVGNSKPERFNKFLEQRLETKEINLNKIGLNPDNECYYFEAFGGWEYPKENVEGYFLEFK